MDDYNFWQDFFDTYQSLSDWMKFAWLVVPPIFLLGFIALIMRYRLAGKRVDRIINGDLVYSIYRDEENQFHMVAHGREIHRQPALLPLDPPNGEPPSALDR